MLTPVVAIATGSGAAVSLPVAPGWSSDVPRSRSHDTPAAIGSNHHDRRLRFCPYFSVDRQTGVGPLDVGGVRELAVLERSGLIESRHLGAAVVLSAEGVRASARSATAPHWCIRGRVSSRCKRSRVMRSGVRWIGARAVLATASHSGTAGARAGGARDARERRAVRNRLALPGRLARRRRRALSRPSGWSRCRVRITMNCSGKHAGVPDGVRGERLVDPRLPRPAPSAAAAASGAPSRSSPARACGGVGVGRMRRAAVRDRPAPVWPGRSAGSPEPAAPRRPACGDADGRDPRASVGHRGPRAARTRSSSSSSGILCKGGAEGVTPWLRRTAPPLPSKILDGSASVTTLVALRTPRPARRDRAGRCDRVIGLTVEPVLGGGRPGRAAQGVRRLGRAERADR